MSLVESVANVLVGFVLALAAQRIVFPLFGVRISLRTDLVICWTFPARALEASEEPRSVRSRGR